MSLKSSAFSITKYLAYAFLGLLALIVIIVMLALSPLGVNTLVKFANDQEGLQIDKVKGSFYSSITLGDIKFETPQLVLNAVQVNVDIDLNCFFLGEACVESFTAKNVEVSLLENDLEPTPASEPLTDYIELPVAASLKRFEIAQFTLNKQSKNAVKQPIVSLTKLSASLSMFSRLQLSKLHVDKGTLFLPIDETLPKTAPPSQQNTLQELLSSLKNYSYQAIQIPQVFVPINAAAKDVLIKQFCIKQVDDICTNNTKLVAQISQQKVSANFSSTPLEQLVANVEADIKIDIANQYQTQIIVLARPNKALTSKQAETFELQLSGNTQAAKMTINAGRQRQNIASLSASLDLTQANLPVDIDVQAKQYSSYVNAWFPGIDIPIESAKLALAGTTQAYKLASTAIIKSEHASELNLQGELSLNNKSFVISKLSTSGDIGNLDANASVKLDTIDNNDGLDVGANVNFTGLQLQPLLPNMNSQLDGQIKLNAKVTPAQIWGDLICTNIKGQLQGYDLALLCNVDINKSGLLKVNSLSLSQGVNKVTAKGSFALPTGLSAKQLPDNSTLANTKGKLVFDIQLNDIATLYPQASGVITANAQVNGKIDAPTVDVNANIDMLRFNQIRVNQANLTLNVDIANDWQSNIVLKASEIWAESLIAQQLDIAAKGDLKAHELQLDLTHPEYSLSHTFTGEAFVQEQNWRWQGMWEKGVFSSAFDSWVLNQPAGIKASPDSAYIKSHCWLSTKQNDNAEQQVSRKFNKPQGLCVEKATYTLQQAEFAASINYNANTALLHYFPDIVQKGTSIPLNTEVDVIYTPNKGIKADAYSLVTQAKLISTNHVIDLVAIVANVSLSDEILKTNIFAGTKDTGAIGFRSELALDPENRTHKGQLQIDEFLLSPLQRFIPTVEKLAGKIEGNLLFDGTLTEPMVNGQLLVNDAALYLEQYPYPVTNFNQTIEVIDNITKIDGEFELGSGTAQYNGTATFEETIAFNGELKGAGMQLAFNKNEVLVSPSLTFAVDPDNFSLKGEIIIPNAQIAVTDLPESAKSQSSDTIIIGQPVPPPIVPIGLDIDVRVVLDPSKLKRVAVKAFDLEASLGGDLRVQVIQERSVKTNEFRPLETYVNGSINVLSGSYEAYGQKLQIREGSIYFNGAPSLPQFDITAIRNPLNTENNVEAGIRISGNPVMPKVELFSDPTMIQARQLSYLLNGTDLDGGEGTSTNVFLVNALVSFGVGNSDSGFNKLGKSLGFNSLNLQTAGQGDNTQVQLTGRLSDNIQVTYGVGVFDQVSEVILKYQLLPKLYLEAKSGTESAVDLFYEVTRGD